MASLGEKDNIEISIPDSFTTEKVTYYKILVKIGDYFWTASHRYSEFSELHSLLVNLHGLSRDLLPPKKLIGNKDPSFIEKRKKDLELYLQTVVSFMSTALPDELAKFLSLELYEVNFILKDLAKICFKSDELKYSNQFFTFTPLQLMSISQQLERPSPRLFVHEKETDFTNIVDFCSSVKNVRIQGSSEPYELSNIVMNELVYNLNVFKNVETLWITGANVSKVDQLGCVRRSVKELVVESCELSSPRDILAADSVHKEVEERGNFWPSLERLNLSQNNIDAIDESVVLVPSLTHLKLCSNRLSSIGCFLTKLPHLLYLDLSNNQVREVNDLHTKLGNVKRINLSRNELGGNAESLVGFSKLYSVMELSLASNGLADVASIEPLASLPCLEELDLTGNPVTASIDYRVRVLELFGDRAPELCLDNERPTRKELDKVAVLRAMKLAREGRLPNLNISTPRPSTTVVDLHLQRPDVATVATE